MLGVTPEHAIASRAALGVVRDVRRDLVELRLGYCKRRAKLPSITDPRKRRCEELNLELLRDKIRRTERIVGRVSKKLDRCPACDSPVTAATGRESR